MAFCHNCRYQMPDGSLVCPNCRISQTPLPPQAQGDPQYSAPVYLPPQYPQTQYPQAEYPPPPYPPVPYSQMPYYPPMPRRSSFWPVVAVIAAIVVVAVVAIGAFFYRVGDQVAKDVVKRTDEKIAADNADVAKDAGKPSATGTSVDGGMATSRNAIQSVEGNEKYLFKGFHEAISQVTSPSGDPFQSRANGLSLMRSVDNLASVLKDLSDQDRQINLSECPRDYSEAHENVLSAMSSWAFVLRAHPAVPSESEYLFNQLGDFRTALQSWEKESDEQMNKVDESIRKLKEVDSRYGVVNSTF
jgi:hypothetical protein